MYVMIRIILISASLLLVGCAGAHTNGAEPIDIKVVNSELRKAKKALHNEDIETALSITKKYAELGHAKAQYMYGHYIYLKFYAKNYGKGMTQRIRRQEAQAEEETLKWMIKSAEQGYVGGQSYLGGHFLEGDYMRNRKSDYVQGLMWTILAASQSNEKDSVNAAIDQVLNNYDITEAQIKEAKRLADEWRPSSSRLKQH